MASTRSRPRGREHARPSTGGVTAEHATMIYTVAIVGILVIVAFLALTSIGHVIDAATQHFMLFYAGVFALIGLCASVALGLVATDRMFLHPGRRIFIQSAHRAASFGAVAFLITHVVTEILAQRVHALDAVVPFLSPFRTFYIGLGTIASDLLILLAITGIMRGRFNANGKAWRWRAIHYTSYAAFVFGIWHGLLGGRPGKPYVDWSYGFVVAFVLLGLAVRVLSNSLRPKENLSAPPVDQSASSGLAPLRAAAMLSQYGATRGGRTALGGTTGSQPVLSAPLAAPVMTALPATATTASQGQPFYEPGYDGPPRYLGAPRSADSGPIPRAATGSLPRVTGSMPTITGSYPAASGRMTGGGSGPMSVPNATTPMPRPGSGAYPAMPAGSGPYPIMPAPVMPAGSGAYPTMPTGSGAYPVMPAGSGAYPTMPAGSGAYPVMPAGSGAYPAMPAGSGAYPVMPSGSGPYPVMPTGPQPWTGSTHQAGDGRQADWETGPRSRPSPAPTGAGGVGGAARSAGTGSWPRQNGPASGPYARPATAPMPQGGHPSGAFPAMPSPYPDGAGGGRPGSQGWPSAGQDGGWYPEEQQWDGGFPEGDPNLRYRDPGPGMPGYRGSREHRYGGDR